MPSAMSKHLANFPTASFATFSNSALAEALTAAQSDPNLGKPDDFTWRDYLLMLLRIDAGIEHALMVQYLYAAYSLGGEQVPPDKRPMVRRWQQTLLSIAKEEMGHLITVQNVITCLGGAISLEREDYPWDHDFYPFPFELEPLTLDSLAKYVYTEAPIGWGEQGRLSGVAEQVHTVLQERHEGLRQSILSRLQAQPVPPKPDGVKSVAALFKVILGILQDPDRLSEDDFNAASYAWQASWDAWSCNHGQRSGEEAADENQFQGMPGGARTCPTTADLIIVPVATRDDVIDALQQVAEQGESPHSEQEQSHFARFLHIYDEFSTHFPSGCETQPARELPINPTTFANLHQSDGDMARRSTRITHPESVKWAQLFDLRYRLLLTFLAHSFRLARAVNPNKGAGAYQAVVHRAFGEMYNLKAISEILVRQPLDADPDLPFRPAGPPFQMPYTLELPETSSSCWLQYLEMLKACANLREALEQNGDLSPRETEYLQTQANADRACADWLNTQLEAARVSEEVAP